jgi:threonine dehydrogenase-like Zn-dependent dehydrogenase
MFIPAMESGDVLGHETMGEVVEVGACNREVRKGDRVVVPFTISCGNASSTREAISQDASGNPNAETAAKLWGHSPAGLFG